MCSLVKEMNFEVVTNTVVIQVKDLESSRRALAVQNVVCFVHLVQILKKRFVEMSAILEALFNVFSE